MGYMRENVANKTAALLIAVGIIFMVCMNVEDVGVEASDADAMQDFCVTDVSKVRDDGHEMSGYGFACKRAREVEAGDFKSGVLREAGNISSSPLGAALKLAWAGNVGGLNTQGLSFVRMDLGKGGVVPPHVHPRASEVLFVVTGSVQAGFVDSANRLFSQALQAGDLFVFPRGLLHFIHNVGDSAALCVSSLNSQNPGASLAASALFGAHPALPDAVLQASFQLSPPQVRRLKKMFG